MNSKYSCWVYQIRAIVVDDDSTISSYIPFRHKHIVFSFVLRVCTVSNHDLHSNIRNWSRDHLCIFAKLTPVHTTDVKDFCKIDRNHKKKKRQTSKFLKDYIRLLRLFLYICSISLVVKPIGQPRDNRTLRSKPISQFFSVVTVRSLSLVSPCAAEAYIFIFFKHSKLTAHEKVYFFVTVRLCSRQFRANARRSQRKRTVVQDCAIELRPARLLPLAGFLWGFHTADAIGQPWRQVWTYFSEQFSPLLQL